MSIEYELRFLEIDTEEIINKLNDLGAIKIGSFTQKRYVYDYNPPQKGKWIRLRTNGIKTTLTLKEITSQAIDGTSELEIIVSDFENTNCILNRLGYKHRAFQENFRIEYTLDDVNFDIDFWPFIPAYLEIESVSEEKVLNAVENIGFSNVEYVTKGVDEIYKSVYNIDLNGIKDLSFSERDLLTIKKYIGG